jgi:hypothetical protein
VQQQQKQLSLLMAVFVASCGTFCIYSETEMICAVSSEDQVGSSRRVSVINEHSG